MKRLAIYARVSTDQQTVEPQLHALREYAARRSWEPVEYVDAGVSGAKDRRPALDQLLADCRKRNVDAVAVVRLDRLARSVRHLVTLAGELEALGIDLIATEQSIDTSTPVGRFTFTTLGAVAELERDLIRERVVAGVAAANLLRPCLGLTLILNRRRHGSRFTILFHGSKRGLHRRSFRPRYRTLIVIQR